MTLENPARLPFRQPEVQQTRHRWLSMLLAMSSVGAALSVQAGEQATPEHATLTNLRRAITVAESSSRPPTFARDRFLQAQPISDAKLSANARYLVYRLRLPQQSDLMLFEINTNRHRRLLADVRQLSVEWADAGNALWLADDNGLARYELSTGNVKRVLKWDAKRDQRWWGVDANAPQYALVREKMADNGSWQYRVLRVAKDGKTALLLSGRQPLRGVLLNRDGSLGYASVYDGAQYDTVIRRYHQNRSDNRNDPDGAAATGEDILRCTGTEQCGLLGHDEASQSLWLISHAGQDRSALQRWSRSDNGAPRWHVKHSDPAQLADVASVLWQNPARGWLAIAYHPDRRHWYGRDEVQTKALQTLQAQLPDASLTLSTSDDGACWLVQAKHAQWQRDRYFLYRPDSQVLQPLFTKLPDAQQALAADQLAPAVPLHYRARDGALVHGYVYLPRGRPTKTVPLIAGIHGGPFNRDRDHYDAIVQLLVNRGYAVFTPNFRASTGYGQRYLHAPSGDFSDATSLHDILDGMDFLLQHGVGDRQKQAVMGHSYGGYASLLAVSHAPARFRFAVASAAPVDFNWVMQEIIENGGSALPQDGPPGDIFMRHHGFRFEDKALREKMRRESPLAMIQHLQTPIYLWAGARDDRVPVKSLSHYAGEAKRSQKTVTLLIDPEAGHSPDNALNQEALVYLLESAGARHFGGALTPPSAQLETFLRANLRLNAEDVKLN